MTRAIDDLERQIGELTGTLAPNLMALFGCGSLTVAKLVAEITGIGRFRSCGPCISYRDGPRYQSGGTTSSVIGSAVAATVSSTPPCTVSPSPNFDAPWAGLLC
jgi:hypothetical protein